MCRSDNGGAIRSDTIKLFERCMGGRWTGVSFHREVPAGARVPDRPMAFCAAIPASYTGALTLTRETVACPGARASFGWQANGDAEAVRRMTASVGLELPVAEKLLEAVPKILDSKIVAITVGDYRAPDILLSHMQPAHMTRFVQMWQNAFHENLSVSVSAFMSVCGHVAAQVYTNRKVCCAFGGAETRRNGCIGRDRLVVGVPVDLVGALF